jgi:hypothetical protein
LNFSSILSLYYLSADFSMKFVGDDPNYKNDLFDVSKVVQERLQLKQLFLLQFYSEAFFSKAE